MGIFSASIAPAFSRQSHFSCCLPFPTPPTHSQPPVSGAVPTEQRHCISLFIASSLSLVRYEALRVDRIIRRTDSKCPPPLTPIQLYKLWYSLSWFSLPDNVYVGKMPVGSYEPELCDVKLCEIVFFHPQFHQRMYENVLSYRNEKVCQFPIPLKYHSIRWSLQTAVLSLKLAWNSHANLFMGEWIEWRRKRDCRRREEQGLWPDGCAICEKLPVLLLLLAGLFE